MTFLVSHDFQLYIRKVKDSQIMILAVSGVTCNYPARIVNQGHPLTRTYTSKTPRYGQNVYYT